MTLGEDRNIDETNKKVKGIQLPTRYHIIIDMLSVCPFLNILNRDIYIGESRELHFCPSQAPINPYSWTTTRILELL